MNPVFAHCLAEAPDREAVGLVVRHADQQLEAIPLINASPTPRTAFAVAAREWMAVEARVLAAGATFLSLYHSHLDAPAELSARDRAFLTPDQGPLISGLEAWVISVRRGAIAEVRAYGWTGKTYDFVQNHTIETIESALFRKGCFGL